MFPVRRLVAILIGLVLSLTLAAADASAARRHSRTHMARVTTATYRTAVRPHAAHRLHAARLQDRRFAEMAHRSPHTRS